MLRGRTANHWDHCRANTNTNANANAHTNADPHTNADTDTDPDTDTNPDAHTNANADADANSDPHADTAVNIHRGFADFHHARSGDCGRRAHSRPGACRL